MKKYKVETVSSLDSKLDIREVIIDGDKFVQGDDWVTMIFMIGETPRKVIVPREQIKRIEELLE